MVHPVDSDLDPALEALAQGLVDALESADLDAWHGQFAEDGVTWHSYNCEEMDAKVNADGLRGLFTMVVQELRYEDVRRRRFDGGYVQQHTLRLRARTGAEFQTAVCQVVWVSEGRVARLEEYLDSSVIQFGQENATGGRGQS